VSARPLTLETFCTEFMQEMDGLTSSGANKEARVSVVAATNRPFVSCRYCWRYRYRSSQLIYDCPPLGHGRSGITTTSTKVSLGMGFDKRDTGFVI
jgi:hypothetical protein